MSSSNPTFALVAGEVSGDLLGAGLIRSLKERFPQATFVGIGGSKMQAEGLDSWYPMDPLSVMDVFEVLRLLPSLLRLRKNLIERLLALQPDVFIGIDAPDFNLKLEGALKRQGIPTIHYVGPSVWAWRERRLKKIKHQVNGVLTLFPFEAPFYHKYDIPMHYVGHPLASQIPEHINQLQARKALDLPKDVPVTGILPGSRFSEINLLIRPYLKAAALLAQDYPQMEFVVPYVNQSALELIETALEELKLPINVHLIEQQAQLVMAAADQLLITSGTATLEASLMQRPMVLGMKVHPISYWIMRRLATTKWIGLPNILAGEGLVTELIQQDATPEKLAQALKRVIEDQALREKQLTTFRAQHKILKQNASERAADAVVEWANLKPLLHG